MTNGKNYNVRNGTSYDVRTGDALVKVLENLRQSQTRIRVFYGDTKTGKSWLEEHDIEGRIGRSTGTVKIPLLVHNARSSGGGSLLDSSIVRIIDAKTKRVYYSHPKFHVPKLEIKSCKIPREEKNGEMEFYTAEVYADGAIQARFTSEEKAKRYVKKMQG